MKLAEVGRQSLWPTHLVGHLLRIARVLIGLGFISFGLWLIALDALLAYHTQGGQLHVLHLGAGSVSMLVGGMIVAPVLTAQIVKQAQDLVGQFIPWRKEK